MKQIIVCFFCILTLQTISSAQEKANAVPATSNGQFKDFLPPSPNAASLGIFGQIPVGSYTGIPVIDVPFYTIQYKELKVPLGISYHAAGNKPDNFPGPVGLGWSLQAGGTVTRIVRGMPDYEVYDIGNVLVPELYNPTGEPLWSSDSLLNRNLKYGYYTVEDKSNPDEYYFNFNGMSGRFYLHHTGTFQIKSNQGIYLDITIEVKEGNKIKMPHLEQIPNLVQLVPPSNDTLEKAKMLYKITIKDPQGITYTFGGNYESIEFSRPGHNFSNYSPATMHHRVLPTTWNLTSMESPNKYKINFEYKRGFVVTKVGYNNVQDFTWSNNMNQVPLPGTQSSDVDYEKSTLMNVCYLSKIISPVDSVMFTTSAAANQLQFPRDPFVDSMSYHFAPNSPSYASPVYENLFVWYRDICFAQTQDLHPEKYDQIRVFNKAGKVYKTIALSFTNSTNTRLKLTKLDIYGSDYQAGRQTYNFEYNALSLPPYVSYQTDHYGYYNGRTPYMPRRVTINADSLFQSREPDTAFVQAEILKRIFYPTGGHTEFEYEANTYRSHVNTWPFTVTQDAANKITGGVRIKKVTNYTSPGSIASVKKYYYTKDYKLGGSMSSGVLAYQPTYYESYIDKTVTYPARYASSPGNYTGLLDLVHWSTNPIFPMGETRGNHIVYSEVTEVSADSSFIVYKYKNYDNGFNDKEPVNKKSDNTPIKEFWKEDEGISMDIERGQLLSEELYNASKVLRKKTVYKYNDDTARFANNVRALIYTENNLPFHSYRIVANLIYTYFPYLKEVITHEYEGTDSLITSESYEYNEQYRLVKKKSTTSSEGRTLATITRYPFDLSATADSVIYKAMISKGMVNAVVEQEEQSNGVTLGKSITRYAKGVSLDTALIFPESIKTQFRSRSPEVRSKFNLYDSSGCLLSTSVEKGITTCYIWSYGQNYPIAKIINADYNTVKTALGGQEKIDSFAILMPSDTAVINFLAPLRAASGLSAARITCYTYDPLTGLTSETDENGLTTYYDYDNMGRLIHVRDNDRKIIKKICYNYAGQQVDCGSGKFTAVDLNYASSKLDICDPDTTQLIQIVTAYSHFDEDAVVSSALDTLLYASSDFITPLPTGYYRKPGSWNPSFPLIQYYYVLNGRLLYTNFCGNDEPFILMYADTLSDPDLLCAGSFPLVAAFPGNSNGLVVGQYLYQTALHDSLSYLKDGYYKYQADSSYIKVENGEITEVHSCLSSPSVNQVNLVYDTNLLGGCPLGFPDTYYYGFATLTTGVTLYYDADLTMPVTYGFYSGGGKRYSVNGNGVITAVGNCF